MVQCGYSVVSAVHATGPPHRKYIDVVSQLGKFMVSAQVHHDPGNWELQEEILFLDFWGFCDPECQSFYEALAKLRELEGNERYSSAFSQPCTCKAVPDCPIIADVYSLALRGHPEVKALFLSQIRKRICDPIERTITCCLGPDADISSTSSLPGGDGKGSEDGIDFGTVKTEAPITNPPITIPAVTEPPVIITSNETLGTWRPNPEFGECGSKASFGTFIVRGDDTIAEEFNFPALLGGFSGDKVSYVCGGTVLNGWYVLTAAHCFDARIQITEIVLGEQDVSMEIDGPASLPVQKFSPAEILIHPSWSIRRLLDGFDIALVRLDRRADLFLDLAAPSNVVPVCIPWQASDPGFELSQSTTVTVIGWGVTDKPTQIQRANLAKYGVVEPILQKVELDVVDSEACLAKYTGLQTQTVICASKEGQDSCSGDSGGPLIFRKSPFDPWFQAGIVSFGPNNCGTNLQPGVYTKISAYLPWIIENLKE
eukprot:maker-scaffold231_size243715-snap-gene-1.37 protein:Tk10034 transcript:maker-scaffold231_size243715-snap-gene-1.37-mRNA-1 annotation:"serine protease easter precursor"